MRWALVAVVLVLGGCGSATSGQGAFEEDGEGTPTTGVSTTTPPATTPPATTPPATTPPATTPSASEPPTTAGTTPPASTTTATTTPVTTPPATTPPATAVEADINVCDGKIFRFSDLPYEGMADTTVPGPTKSEPADIPVADVVCQWDVFDFIKGYTPPTPVKGDCRLGDLGCSINKITKSTSQLAEILRNQRVIILTIGYANERWQPKKASDFPSSYQQAGRTIRYVQYDGGKWCNFFFPYGDGSLLATLGDSTAGRYGPSCDAARGITTTLLEREPA